MTTNRAEPADKSLLVKRKPFVRLGKGAGRSSTNTRDTREKRVSNTPRPLDPSPTPLELLDHPLLRMMTTGDAARPYAITTDSIFKQSIPDAASHSRGASRPSCACLSRPKSEGVGNAGRPVHPQPRVQSRKHTGGDRRFTRINPAFPHAMVLTVSFVLSPVIGLLSPSLAD